MANQKIMIVDDDRNICDLLRMYLVKEGFDCITAYNGSDAITLIREKCPDLVLLDLMMPVIDGKEVCRQVREFSNVPIIMVTALGETSDKIEGLGLGADDYIVKPFETNEVVARINAVLRRTSKVEIEGTVSYENLEININKYELKVCGKVVEAPKKEMELLYFFASNPNRVFTRDQLLDEVWGFDNYVDSRTVDVHVKRIREKVEGASEKWRIRTVWSVGYKFEVDEP